MKAAKNIELKVGLLVLVAVAILIVFVFAMGGINIEKTYTVYADFDNPGWMSPGAQVKVSGVLAGKVEKIEFHGGEFDKKAGHRVYVRLTLKIRKRFQKTIHEDAEFFVSTQGVLGEQYIEIIPGTYEKPYLKDGAIVQGINPPRMEVALAKGSEVIDTIHQILTENREEVNNIVHSVDGILDVTDETLSEKKDKIGDIIDNVHEMSEGGNELVAGARDKYVENPKIDRIIGNLDSISGKVNKDIGPVMKSARSTLEQTDSLMTEIGPEERGQIKKAIHHLSSSAEKTDLMLGKVDSIVEHVESGEGTLGAFFKDEELYDDLRELIRDLKHNPWKLIWKD